MRRTPDTSPPLPIESTDTALDELAESFRYMERFGFVVADNWLADYETALTKEASLLAAVRIGRPTELFQGVLYRRLNFRTPGGSPWVILYELVEEDGVPKSIRVVHVRHGAAKGNG